MMASFSKVLVISDRLYCWLIRAYPSSFRREFGIQMTQVFRDKCRVRFAQQGLMGLGLIWMHTLGDWLKTILEQHIEEAFHMSGQKWVVQFGALAALVGGLLGLYLLTRGPNAYGNYGWQGWLAPLAALLLAFGLGGAILAYQTALNGSGWAGALIMLAGLLLLGIGYSVEALWALIFIGPVIIAPIGAMLLGLNIYQKKILPTWWRFFPFLIVAVALLGFGIEMFEELTGNSTPDRGLQLTEALFSLAWIGLAIGLWLNRESEPQDPRLAA